MPRATAGRILSRRPSACWPTPASAASARAVGAAPKLPNSSKAAARNDHSGAASGSRRGGRRRTGCARRAVAGAASGGAARGTSARERAGARAAARNRTATVAQPPATDPPAEPPRARSGPRAVGSAGGGTRSGCSDGPMEASCGRLEIGCAHRPAATRRVAKDGRTRPTRNERRRRSARTAARVARRAEAAQSEPEAADGSQVAPSSGRPRRRSNPSVRRDGGRARDSGSNRGGSRAQPADETAGGAPESVGTTRRRNEAGAAGRIASRRRNPLDAGGRRNAEPVPDEEIPAAHRAADEAVGSGIDTEPMPEPARSRAE